MLVGRERIIRKIDFFSYVSNKLGNGKFMDFLKDFWVEATPLLIRFPSLYGLTDLGGSKVSNYGVWKNDV